jgi:Right handed beta helix region/Bacterial TSP3 repeat
MRAIPGPRAALRGGLQFSLLCAVIAAISAAPAAADGRARDADGDGLSNRFERHRSHTKPHKRDTDRDRLSDGFEVRRSKTSPRRRDTDRDGLADGFEVRRSKTSPRRRDSDLDGMADAIELFTGTDPLTAPPASRGLVSGDPVWPSRDPILPALSSPLPDPTRAPEPPAPPPPPPPLDLMPPETSISSGPSGTVGSVAASFSFESSEAGSDFECRLDGGAWSSCSSPRAYSSLANGAHTFEVRATDPAGNTDPTPSSRSWTVLVTDVTPPDTVIGSGPNGTVASDSASFTFTSSEADATFECRLDGGGWAACSSPQDYSGLANGSHSFGVRATDAAGNTDPTPAAGAWTVEVAPSGECDRNAGPATLSSEVSAAAAGETICLASGSYGSWSGTGKAITIRPQSGASPTMRLNLSGSSDGNFTIDGGRDTFSATTGLTITGADITGPVHDMTVKNARFTGGVKFLSHPHPNVVFDHNEHVGIPASDTGAIILPGGSQVHSGVTIRNSYFHDLDPDGIQTGPAINVLDNEFARLDPNRSSAHSDAIQLYCGCGAPGVGSLVKGNYAHDGEQGIVAFDGSGDHVIEDNVVWNFRVHGIVLGGDTPASHVRHNTVGGSGRNQIDCSSKSGFSPSQTAIYDNIAQYVGLSGAVNCTPSRNDHNMVRQSPGTGNFLGNPTFVGGPNPTTYAGFRLAPGSPGKNAASNGQDIGIR